MATIAAGIGGSNTATPASAFEPVVTSFNRLDWTLILPLILIAGVLRISTLGHAPLWFDELCTWRVSHLGFGSVFNGIKEDIHPPCFFLIEAAFIKLFGDSEIVLRLPAALFGTLSIGLLYALGKRALGRLPGFIAALMLALNAQAFYYSQEARPYSMMLFMGLVTSYLWFVLYERVFVNRQQGGRLVIGLFALLVVTCFTHYFCVLIPALQLVIFGIIAFRQKRGRRIFATYTAGLLLIGLCWLPMLQLQMHNTDKWLQDFPLIDAVVRFSKFTLGGVAMGKSGEIAFAGVLTLVILLFVYRRGTRILKPESPKQFGVCLALFALWCGPFLLTEAISLAGKPMYLDRYLLFTMPFGMLLVGAQLSRLPLKAAHCAVLALLVAGFQAFVPESASHWYTQPFREKQGNWQDVAAQVQKELPARGKTVVMAVTERPGVAEYYFGKFAPAVEVAGTAGRKGEVMPALQEVLKQNPDHIVFFFGQIIERNQIDAAVLTKHTLQDAFGQAKVISLKQGMPVGAVMFDVRRVASLQGQR